MHSAQIKFRVKPLKAAPDRTDAIQALLGRWMRNGNILGSEFPIAKLNDKTIAVTVSIPEPKAFNTKHFNGYVKDQLSSMKRAGILIDYKVIGHDPESARVCHCRRPSSYILFTHTLSIESPIRCGKCFGVVALYHLLKFKSGDYSEVIGWQGDYQACDSLQLGCSTGERFAEQEMSDCKSSLSKRGRSVCRELQKVLHKPVYYYLFQPSGKKANRDRNRPCPSCGRKWLLAKRWHELFDFRCDKCHLLSNFPFDLLTDCMT